MMSRISDCVVEVDEGEMRVVADGLSSSNGIHLSRKGTHAYVGELVGRAVSVYRVADRGSWTTEKRISLPFAVDNLTLRQDGKLLVSGHPKLLTLARGYQYDENSPSPSQVVLLDPATGRANTLMQDDGTFFSGSSVAVPVDGRSILFGTTFGPSILRCPVG